MDMRTALVVAGLIASRPALSQTCPLPAGLYAERTRLEEKYVKEARNRKKVPEDIQQQRKPIDQKYVEYMNRVRNGTPETIRACCPPGQQDPIALRVCALASYVKGGRKNVTSFLASVPTDEASAHSLWVLDEIARSQEPPADESKAFQPWEPVSAYVGELYELVLAGNKDAIRKYLGLFLLAQEDAGEEMEADLEELFLHKPALVAENWNIFREYPKALTMVGEMMAEDDVRQAVSSILKECSAKNLNCDGLSSAFK